MGSLRTKLTLSIRTINRYPLVFSLQVTKVLCIRHVSLQRFRFPTSAVVRASASAMGILGLNHTACFAKRGRLSARFQYKVGVQNFEPLLIPFVRTLPGARLRRLSLLHNLTPVNLFLQVKISTSLFSNQPSDKTCSRTFSGSVEYTMIAKLFSVRLQVT